MTYGVYAAPHFYSVFGWTFCGVVPPIETERLSESGAHDRMQGFYTPRYGIVQEGVIRGHLEQDYIMISKTLLK